MVTRPSYSKEAVAIIEQDPNLGGQKARTTATGKMVKKEIVLPKSVTQQKTQPNDVTQYCLCERYD